MDGQQISAVALAKVQDSFTPQWNSAQWQGVDVRRARVRVELIDKDVSNDDPIGTVEISTQQLRDAAAAGSIFPVRVDSQTNGQVLFLLISVM